MKDQKAENLLNLALSVSEADRNQAEELQTGFDPKTKTWKLIVTYHGNLSDIMKAQYPNVQIKELLGGFAILTVPEDFVEKILNIEEIEYAEKPKRLYFALYQAKAVSCFFAVQRAGNRQEELCTIPMRGEDAREKENTTLREDLTGCGVLIGILDSGIDYFHEDFRNPDGTTRIFALYDQEAGRVYSQDEINEALQTGGRGQGGGISSMDPTGHGTLVAGIAAGNGRESGGMYRGAAYQSMLVVVRLGIADPEGFPRTTELMDGLDFIVRTASDQGLPVAVNLSFGNTYGPHDGNGLLERYIDRISAIGRSVFVIGVGNEGDRSGHASGRLETEEEIVELSVGPYERGFGMQIWKSYLDDYEMYLVSPSGKERIQIHGHEGAFEVSAEDTRLLIYVGEPGPFLEAQEIYVEFLPADEYVRGGIWKLLLKPIAVRDGRYDCWLPSSAVLNPSTRFLRPVSETTLTIPSAAHRPISVGAYDDRTKTYASFSGRGDTREYRIQKPDLVAPGVEIIAPKSGGGYASATGTSFAAPLVAGAAALLMEWGIVKGNDPYLYGDKVKMYLKRGAKALSGEDAYPNPRVGWGALCVGDSFGEK